MKRINYNMSERYCSDWSVIDALREISQNAIDSKQAHRHWLQDGYVCINTYDVTLTPEVFVLGNSIKDYNSIGKFGEGFKIAMLVLTRAGLKPSITTDNMIVTGSFDKDDFTGVETFGLDIHYTDEHINNVEFCCHKGNLDIEELEHRISYFSQYPMQRPEVCNILRTKPGTLYVEGLLVQEDKALHLGYNFAASELELNRDRNVVLGLEATLGKYHAAHSSPELVFELLEAEAKDVEWLWCYLDDRLKEPLLKLFQAKHGAISIHRNHGFSGYFSNTQFNTYIRCGVQESKHIPSRTGPSKDVYDWVQRNKKHMRRRARVNANDLIVQAKSWRK